MIRKLVKKTLANKLTKLPIGAISMDNIIDKLKEHYYSIPGRIIGVVT